MNLLLAHPTGNQFFRHLAAGLADHGALGRVATCVNFTGAWGAVARVLPARVRAELERRAFREPWAADLRTHPGRELGRLLAQRAGWTSAYHHETGRFSVDAVYQDFDQWVAHCLPRWQQATGLGGVYAYEDGALATFTAAKELGLFRAYDLPIAYWETGRRLMAEEAERLPAWAPTLGGGIADSPAKLERKTHELELADAVICPSQFVVDSLPEWARDSKQIVLAPFGSPVPEDGGQRSEVRGQRSDVGGQRVGLGRRPGRDGVERVGHKEAQKAQKAGSISTTDYTDGSAKADGLISEVGVQEVGLGRRPGRDDLEKESGRLGEPALPPISHAQRPLRVLFAGSMSQRKGLGDLFAAMRLLKRSDVELVVMGSLQAPMEFYRKELADFTYEPGRPHAQVLELMRSCDVLCLPSVVEGRALVMQEAMSQGLPVIITPNTGGEDLVEEGRTGFLVPIRRPDVIAEKIAWCAGHRESVGQMAQAARIKARDYSWQRYSDTIRAALAGGRRAASAEDGR